ncbi:protein SIX6OS1 isoform X2 [Sminthopsis crassicaudata]|uniref:protein SIX6OS1 isoform X2 n=1 Tax=Sminthopsis crassicaudata TaxID=9301 RepID=UPI003D68B19C
MLIVSTGPSLLQVSKMNDLFIALDKLLLELVFQSEQDSNAKEEAKQQITLFYKNIKEKKKSIFSLRDKINSIDNEIAHCCKHNKYMKENCTNWMPTYDILHKHELFLEEQFQNDQETTERDKKLYHDQMRQCKDVLKHYQLQYSEAPLAQKYNKDKTQMEEIKNRILTCNEQYAIKETILLELSVPVPFKSLSQWALQIVHLRIKTQEFLKCASTLIHKASKMKEETEEMERNQEIERISEANNLPEVLEEKNKELEKTKEFKGRIFEEHGNFHVLNENPRNSQLFLPYNYQNLVRPVRNDRRFSELGGTDKKEEGSSSHSILARIDFRPQRKTIQEFDVSGMNKYSQVSAHKSTQNLMQFRLSCFEKQSNYKQTFDKGNTDSEYGEKETERELKDSTLIPQDSHIEHMDKLVEDSHDETEENTEKFPSTPEMPRFLRIPEFLRTPESVEKLEFSKSPSSELLRNIGLEGKTQKTPQTFSFLMGSSISPGFNLFESSEFGNENLPDQFDENYSSGNLNPVSSQKDIGLFGKLEGEDTFTFPFSSEPSTHTFGDGKDDFSFSFSFEQDQRASQSSSNSFPSSQNAKQFTFF